MRPALAISDFTPPSPQLVVSFSRPMAFGGENDVIVTGDRKNRHKMQVPHAPRGFDTRIVHTQHGEIIVEAGDDTADQVQATVKESMEATLKRIISEVPFVAKIRVGDSWG
jgi:hypothetical protein